MTEGLTELRHMGRRQQRRRPDQGVPDVCFIVRIEPEVKDALDRTAQRLRVSLNFAVVQAVREWVERVNGGED